MGAAADERAGVGVALPDRAGCAEGESNKEIAARLGCSTHDGRASGGRGSRARGLDGLHDEPRPGKPRSIGDDDVERVIVKTLEERPRGRDALVDAVDGHRDGDVPVRGQSRSGGRSGSSRIWPTASSCRRTRSSSTRSATSSGCT